MSLSALWILSAAALPLAHPVSTPVIRTPSWLVSAHHVGSDRAKVSVWMDRQDTYHRGDEAQVYIKAEQDAYVTVLRIDTDGRVRVLFPIDPEDDNFARGGQAFEVMGRSRDAAFRIDDAPGEGYIFAIASTDPFTYDGYTVADHWDYRTIADGRVRGDPYVAVTDLASQIAPEGSWDYDMIQYDVEQHYDYPRFVCYDCHQYTSFYSWNPYDHFCSQYRIVIYDDPFYYPYRYYGTGAVYGRPVRPGPRYVFKDNDGSGGYINRVPFRPRTPDGRYNQDRGRTGADLGGRGSVPIPVGNGGRRVDPLSGARGGGQPGGSWRGRDDARDTPRTGRPVEPGRRNGGSDDGQPFRQGNDNRPNEHQPARRSDPADQPATRPNSDNRFTEHQPERRGDQGNQPATRPTSDQPHDRPTPVQRPPERHDPPPQRNNDRPQSRPSPPPVQPRSSPPPSRPTGEPELRRRKP